MSLSLTVISRRRCVAQVLGFAILGLELLQFSSVRAATISIDPSTQTVGLNTDFQVNLDISGVNTETTAPVGAFDVTVSFDPTLLSFQNATFGNQVDISGLGDIQSVTPGTGSVEVYEISLDSAQALSAQASNFTLATLSFYSIAAGSSAISIGLNGLSDPNGNSIAADIVNGNVVVTAAPVPLPGTLSLLGVGLFLLAGACRLRWSENCADRLRL